MSSWWVCVEGRCESIPLLNGAYVHVALYAVYHLYTVSQVFNECHLVVLLGSYGGGGGGGQIGGIPPTFYGAYVHVALYAVCSTFMLLFSLVHMCTIFKRCLDCSEFNLFSFF